MELVDLLVVKRLKFFLRLHYPAQVTVCAEGFVGRYPDLPGCECQHPEVGGLYSNLEAQRQSWLRRQVMSGLEIPMPNTYLRGAGQSSDNHSTRIHIKTPLAESRRASDARPHLQAARQ